MPSDESKGSQLNAIGSLAQRQLDNTMQAGLTTRRLTFRDIFLATTIPLWSRIEVFLLPGARNPVSSAPVPLPAAA